MIAFLGTGLLGSNWVRNLRTKGEDLHVWNRTGSKAKALESVGAKAFPTPAEAVKGADRIHIAVYDDTVVDSILAEAAPALEKNVIIIDHTTTTANGARKRTAYWQTHGIRYIHAPVFMGPQNALESTGTMLISGDQRIIQTIETDLKKMTGRLENLGEDPGMAASYKLLGNHLFLSVAAGIGDTFTLGKSLGISRDDIRGFIDMMGSTPMKARVDRLLLGNYDNPSWTLSMARKDARLMTEETERAGNKLDVLPSFGAHMDALIEQNMGEQDWTIVVKEAVSE
ncbi:MAG TPA: NAD(P)-dependent oxidoreductase [Candidatus Kapabacteria bacterium]|jgi:3-hydroxyisobutyrate dehydrogenase